MTKLGREEVFCAIGVYAEYLFCGIFVIVSIYACFKRLEEWDKRIMSLPAKCTQQEK